MVGQAAARGVLAFALVFACAGGGGMSVESAMLERALSAEDATAFDAALRAHGPVEDEEVAYLAEVAQSTNPARRRNAARLLAISDPDVARPKLEELATATDDVHVWATAVRALSRSGPPAVAPRPNLAYRAIADDDPDTIAAGLREGARTGIEGWSETAAMYLDHASSKVREAATEAMRGDPAAEERARARIRTETDSATFRALAAVLVGSAAPESAAVIRELFEDKDHRRVLTNLFRTTTAASPWLNDFLLEVATGHAEADARGSAIFTLGKRGDARIRAHCEPILADPPERGEDGFVDRWEVYDGCKRGVAALDE